MLPINTHAALLFHRISPNFPVCDFHITLLHGLFSNMQPVTNFHLFSFHDPIVPTQAFRNCSLHILLVGLHPGIGTLVYIKHMSTSLTWCLLQPCTLASPPPLGSLWGRQKWVNGRLHPQGEGIPVGWVGGMKTLPCSVQFPPSPLNYPPPPEEQVPKFWFLR